MRIRPVCRSTEKIDEITKNGPITNVSLLRSPSAMTKIPATASPKVQSQSTLAIDVKRVEQPRDTNRNYENGNDDRRFVCFHKSRSGGAPVCNQLFTNHVPVANRRCIFRIIRVASSCAVRRECVNANAERIRRRRDHY